MAPSLSRSQSGRFEHTDQETFESAEAGHNANYPTLLAFSLGKLGGTEAQQVLGLDGEEDLYLLMTQARLPMPRLPEAQTADMVNSLRALPSTPGAQEPAR